MDQYGRPVSDNAITSTFMAARSSPLPLSSCRHKTGCQEHCAFVQAQRQSRPLFRHGRDPFISAEQFVEH